LEVSNLKKKVTKTLLIILILNFLVSCSSIADLTGKSNEKAFVEPDTLKCEILNDSSFSYFKKSWTIKFNSYLDKNTITKKNIYIEQSDGEEFKFKIAYSEKNSIIKITPQENYMPWLTYNLVLTSNIKTKSGEKSLTTPIERSFNMQKITYESQIDPYYENYMPLNLNYNGIGPKTYLKNEEELYNEIKYRLMNYEEIIKIKIPRNSETKLNEREIINYFSKYMPLLCNYTDSRIYSYLVSNVENENDKYYTTRTLHIDYDFSSNNISGSEEALKMDKNAREKSKLILEEIITPNMKNWEKEKAIHDYITNNCIYYDDYENSYNSILNSDYGALVNNSAVCGGFAKAFYVLMNESDLPCLFIDGDINAKFDDNSDYVHAWNMVYIDNEYYHVDTTWDTSDIFNEITTEYWFFNIDDERMSNTHKWISDDYPKANGKELTPEKLGFYNDMLFTANDYDEFYSVIKKILTQKIDNSIIKVSNYDADIYDIETVLNKAANNNVFYYSFEYITNEDFLIEGEDELIQLTINIVN
jgi:hypothetical protein